MPRKATSLQERPEAILSLAVDAHKLQSYKVPPKSNSYPAGSKWPRLRPGWMSKDNINIAPEAIKNPDSGGAAETKQFVDFTVGDAGLEPTTPPNKRHNCDKLQGPQSAVMEASS
jgi:hypothetical protein